jgi:hypothetical protein
MSLLHYVPIAKYYELQGADTAINATSVSIDLTITVLGSTTVSAEKITTTSTHLLLHKVYSYLLL